jgi:hypothetical protein
MSKEQDSLKLLGSPRGQYIVGQALAIAVKELEKVEESRREFSNIEDMKFLGENLFKAGYITHSFLSSELLNKIQEEIGNNPDAIIEDTELIEQINQEINEYNDGQEKES